MTGARTPPCFNSEWSLSEVNMFLPPLGGGIFSSTKCLLYPFPVSRPITWRYYLREIRPVRFLRRTHGHIKVKWKTQLWIWLYIFMSRCFHESVRRGWHLGFKHLLVGLTKQAPFYCLIFIGASSSSFATQVDRGLPERSRPKSIKFLK